MPEIWLVVSLAASLGSFAGWLVGSRWLSGFGVAAYPDWPLAAAANAFIALALAAAFLDRPRLSVGMLTVPAVIALASLTEYTTGAQLGLDSWMFARAVRDVALANPGRPGLIPTISILLITAIALLVRHRSRWVDPAILTVGCVTVGLASMSMALLFLGADLARQSVRLASSLPASIAPIALAFAIFSWRGVHVQSGLISTKRPEWRVARIGLPVIACLPAILLPIEGRIVQAGLLPPLTTEILASAINLLLVVALLSWGIARLSRDHDALSESNTRLELASDAHEITLFDWEVATGKLSWTPGAEQRFGLAPGAITDFETWKTIVEPADLLLVSANIAEAIAHKARRFPFRYRIRRPDGVLRTIEGSARCFYDVHEEVTRMVGAQLDVTDRDERVAALAAREALLASILETVPDALVVIDEDGIVRNFSAAAERMFGYRADELIGHDALCLLPKGKAGEEEGFLTRYRLGSERGGGRGRLTTAVRADGSLMPVELHIGQSWNDRERRYTAFIRDVSEQIASEQRLEALRGEYAHSARLSAMSEVIAGIAHELNQPLAASTNFLGAAEIMLAQDQDPRRAAEVLGQVATQILRAGEIIRRLRDFIAKGDIGTHPEPLDEIVRDALALGLLGDDRLDIRVDCRIDRDATMCTVDRIQIQQVLVNLLRNAAEALAEVAPERRVIRIRSRLDDDGMVEVSVSDSGLGLSPTVLAHLFQPFLSTKGAHGLGIGLSICRRIVEAHGGTLSAGNQPEGGACFVFTLPGASEQYGSGDRNA